MTYSYTIIGETPAKKNSRITLRNGCTIPSKNFQKWHKIALAELEMQEKPSEPLDCPCRVFLRFIHGDLRRRDSDNGTSSIMDLLVDAGILYDDNWQIVRQIKVQNEYIKNEARCEVIINEWED